VQEHPVAGEEVELAGGAPAVVPVDHERVDPVLDVLLVARDLRGHAGRPAVEALQRRPEHPLDLRELEDHVRLRVALGELPLGDGADDLVGALGAQAGAVGRHHGEVARLAHLPGRGDRLVDALEPRARVALDEDPQRSGRARLDRSTGGKTALSMPLRTRRHGASGAGRRACRGSSGPP
jgi:hypothetical protein